MLIKNSDQNTQAPGAECDYSCGKNTTFDQGYAVVSQGATGRYCEVMWLCDDCGNNGGAIDVEEAREKCNADPRGYADF